MPLRSLSAPLRRWSRLYGDESRPNAPATLRATRRFGLRLSFLEARAVNASTNAPSLDSAGRSADPRRGRQDQIGRLVAAALAPAPRSPVQICPTPHIETSRARLKSSVTHSASREKLTGTSRQERQNTQFHRR